MTNRRIDPSNPSLNSLFNDPFELLNLVTGNTGHQTSYPPYNIIKETDDKFVVEIALAGFRKEEIKIEAKQNTLIVSGKKVKQVAIDGETEVKYTYKGIATRDFVREFALAQYVFVRGAHYQDGILSIKLEREIPEEKKTRIVDIE